MFPKIIGHRGFPHSAPENTMESYIAAVSAGADGLEIDIRMTRDGELVLIHDETLDRTTDGIGSVGLYTLREIRRLNAGRRFGGQAKIPTLREFLDCFAYSGLTLIMELKTKKTIYPGIEEKLVELLHEYGPPDNVIIASFSRSSLLSVRRLDSRLKTGILLKYWPIPQPFTPPSGVDTLLPQFRNFRRIGVRRLAKSGFPVYPFTVNQPRMMQKMIDFGVTGIITDRCDLLCALKAKPSGS